MQSKQPSKKPLLGGSLFSDANGAAAPPEIAPLVPLQQSLSRASLAIKPSVTKADIEYAALTDGSQPTPTPPVHAARLSSLVKLLANAEDAVAESLKTRRALITGLEKLLETNRAELASEEAQHGDLGSKKEAMTNRRHEVENHIMRGLTAEEAAHTVEPVAVDNDNDTAVGGAALNSSNFAHETERPEMEGFTPPPMSPPSTTPPGLPQSIPHTDGTEDLSRPIYESFTPPPAAFTPTAPLDPRRRPTQAMSTKAQVVHAHPRPGSASPTIGNGSMYGANASAKRRKMSSQEDEFPGFGEGEDALEGLDADVVGMLS